MGWCCTHRPPAASLRQSQRCRLNGQPPSALHTTRCPRGKHQTTESSRASHHIEGQRHPTKFPQERSSESRPGGQSLYTEGMWVSVAGRGESDHPKGLDCKTWLSHHEQEPLTLPEKGVAGEPPCKPPSEQKQPASNGAFPHVAGGRLVSTFTAGFRKYSSLLKAHVLKMQTGSFKKNMECSNPAICGPLFSTLNSRTISSFHGCKLRVQVLPLSVQASCFLPDHSLLFSHAQSSPPTLPQHTQVAPQATAFPTMGPNKPKPPLKLLPFTSDFQKSRLHIQIHFRQGGGSQLGVRSLKASEYLWRLHGRQSSS